MKQLLFIIAIMCLAVTGAMAQAPTTAFDVDGIKVIFKPTVKEILDVRLFFRGGVTNYGTDQAGIESFALNAARNVVHANIRAMPLEIQPMFTVLASTANRPMIMAALKWNA